MGDSMSIVLQSTGGGSVTINEPTTASNFTQTLPAATGDVMVSGNMPAFLVGNNATQSISNTTFTKVLFQAETFDTNNNFASSTFTPTVAGYYQINGIANFQASTAVTRGIVSIYKNGSEYARGTDVPTTIYGAVVSTVVYCNGSTDYIELYALITAGAPVISSGTVTTQMSGFLARTA